MAEGLDNQAMNAAAGIDNGVDPIILAIILMIFAVGAVGPFVALLWGAAREKNPRRFGASSDVAGETLIANPVDPGVIPAADTVGADTVGVDTAIDAIDTPANDYVADAESTPVDNAR